MRKLSFRSKMILSILTFTLPIAILSKLMHQAHAVNIDFGSKEVIGNLYQRPLQKILESVSWHRIYSRRENSGEVDNLQKTKQLEAAIAADFVLLEKVDTEYGETLEFTAVGLSKRGRAGNSLADMKTIWNEIIKNPSKDENHVKLIAGLRTMINHLGDTSNLILDPDLDSYYLMDTTLLAMPQTQDRLQEIIINLDLILKKGSFSPTDRSKAAVYSAFLKEVDRARIAAAIKTVLAEDENFYGRSDSLDTNLNKVMDPFFKDIDKLAIVLDRLADPLATIVSPTEFRSVADSALSSSFRPWLTASEELEKLITRRIKVLSNQRFLELAISLGIWIFSCFFSFRISQNLTHSIFNSVNRLSATGVNVGQSSGKLDTTSQSLSASTTESAASLEESVASVEELNSMVKRTAETSEIVSNLSRETEVNAVQGEKTIKDLAQKMNYVASESKKVEDIIGVIDDIAFQTNLLALNAAVEAARAGEQGKGFAVVAESVRTLASRCTDSAKEISGLIKSNVKNIRDGAVLAEKCGTSLQLVSDNIKKLANLNKEVTTACNEQSTGLSQISLALSSLDTVSQNNATSSEELASASKSLFKESQEMQTQMNYLNSVVFGESKKAA